MRETLFAFVRDFAGAFLLSALLWLVIAIGIAEWATR
jgi:hypothetical protein